MIWQIILRQILLRGNFLAGDAETLRLAYLKEPLSKLVLTQNGAMYSFEAICDGVIQAMTLILSAIGENRESQHRSAFIQDTAPLVSGAVIPTLSASGASRFGVIRDVREYVDPAVIPFGDVILPKYLTHQPRTLIDVANRQHPRTAGLVYYYYTDDVRLWHTSGFASAEIVACDMERERENLVEANDAELCPLPVELIPALEWGSLAFIQRDTFNAEQAMMNHQKFAAELGRIAGKQVADLELPAKA